MRMFETLFVILFGFSLLTNAQTAIRIPMGQNIDKAKELPVSLIAEDIQFIPLETNAECFLDQDISKIEIFDNTIFISDYKYIYKFDLHGKFLKRIGRFGRGPGEYASPGFQTFLIDQQNNELILFDLVSQKMIVYDFEGEFIRDKTVDISPGPTEWIGDKSFAVYNLSFTYESEPWKDFYELDREAETLSKNRFLKQHDKRYGLNIYPAIFYKYKGKTMYKNPHENIIYEISDSKKPRPVYYLDYGKYDKYSDIDDVEIRVKNNGGINKSNPKSFEKIGLLGLSETDDFLYIYYGHQDQRKVGVFDKKENTFYQLLGKDNELFGYKDDLFGGLPIFPKNGIVNNALFTHYDVHELKEYLSEAPSVDSKLKKVIDLADENDNPVVILVTLKQ